MADGADIREPAYSAFLSYSRRDAARAHAIHEALERYHLPHRLHPRTNAWNARGQRLKPLFRDLDEMTVAPDISNAVREAIGSSAFLIVLCSPQSAQSDWVGREIEMFRSAHGDAAILAALIEGTPATAFHPALLHNEGGALLQPLAADFRPEGDGPRLARLKLVAVMAGLGLGELVQRDAQRRMRQIGFSAALIVAMVAIVATLVVIAQRSRDAADQQSARAGAMSSYMLEDLRSNLKRYGSLGMLAEVNQSVMESFRGRDLAGLGDAELQQLAKLRLAMGEDAEQRGDLKEAQQQIAEASRTTAARLAAAPTDPQRIFDHAQSRYYVGLIDWRTGDRTGAEAAFRDYRTLAQQLVKADASNPEWWMEVGYAEANLGMYALRTTRDTAAAGARFRSALAAFETVARLKPGDRKALGAIGDAHAWLGDTLRVGGDYAGASASRLTERTLWTQMRATYPGDRDVLTHLVSNEVAMGRIAAGLRRWQDALAAFDRGRGMAAELAQADPENVRRASQLRFIALLKLRTWLTMPARMRPAPAVLAATNGDCTDDRLRLKSDELAEFCTILAARRTGAPQPPAGTATDALTERWGLDFAEERRAGMTFADAGGR